jgi:excisionase family DNA binding protein
MNLLCFIGMRRVTQLIGISINEARGYAVRALRVNGRHRAAQHPHFIYDHHSSFLLSSLSEQNNYPKLEPMFVKEMRFKEFRIIRILQHLRVEREISAYEKSTVYGRPRKIFTIRKNMHWFTGNLRLCINEGVFGRDSGKDVQPDSQCVLQVRKQNYKAVNRPEGLMIGKTELSPEYERAISERSSDLTDSERLLQLYLTLPERKRHEEFAGTAEVAEITCLSQRTIQLWIEIGAIQAISIGKKYQVYLSSLREYLKTQLKKHEI